MQINNNLTYSEAIEKVMLNNGYFAPLKLLYREIWKYKDKNKIIGKTPDYTIQERVQRDERFKRIGLGVYALTEYLDKLPKQIEPKNEKEQTIRKHAEMQGMLLEIGNFKSEVKDTYTNDKKWVFQNKTLGSLATLDLVPMSFGLIAEVFPIKFLKWNIQRIFATLLLSLWNCKILLPNFTVCHRKIEKLNLKEKKVK